MTPSHQITPITSPADVTNKHPVTNTEHQDTNTEHQDTNAEHVDTDAVEQKSHLEGAHFSPTITNESIIVRHSSRIR